MAIVSRKQAFSFLLLIAGGVSLALTPNGLFVNYALIDPSSAIPNWAATLIFGLVTLIVGSDYRVVRHFSKKAYNWIQYGQLKTIIEKNNKAREYFEEVAEGGEVEELPIVSIGNGDFRAHLEDTHDIVETGMRFDVCVAATAELPNDDEIDYKLELGEAVVDGIKDADDRGKIAFLSVDEWKPESEFHDEGEVEIAQRCIPQLEEGNTDALQPYAKVTTLGDHEAIDILEWDTIYKWHSEVLQDF